jgi:hypothetical protein
LDFQPVNKKRVESAKQEKRKVPPNWSERTRKNCDINQRKRSKLKLSVLHCIILQKLRIDLRMKKTFRVLEDEPFIQV